MLRVAVVALGCLVACVAAASCPFPYRVPGSPFPGASAGANAVTSLTLFNSSTLTPAQVATMQTLQGALARSTAQLFQVGNVGADNSAWLASVASRFPAVEVDASVARDFPALVARFAGSVDGYVLFSTSQPDSITASLSYAAAHAGVCIIVADADEATVKGAGVTTQLADARSGGDTTNAGVLAGNPLGGGSLRANLISLQAPAQYTCLSDWSVFGRAFTFYDTSGDLPSNLSQAVLHQVQPPAAMLGWGPTEGDTIGELSKFGVFTSAANYASNLATLAGFQVPCLRQPQRRNTTSDAESSPAALKPKTPTAHKHTVAFLMTDGDNVQWVLNAWATDPRWYASPDRGKVPLGWTLSTAFAEIGPTVMDDVYGRGVVGKDEFVAGVSGAGYLYPEQLPASGNGSLAAFAHLTAAFMAKADMRVVNVLDNEGKDCSPSCTDPYLQQAGVDGVLLYYGAAYVGGNGGVTWSSSKPVVRGRYAMWGAPNNKPFFDDPVTLARKLRYLPKDPANAEAYSLVPVHVWTHNVSDVVTAAALLGDAGFNVVPPETLVQQLSANVFHDCASAKPATGSFTDTCTVGSDTCGVLRDTVCKGVDAVGAAGTLKNPFFDHTRCAAGVANCYGRLVCAGDPCGKPTPPPGSYAGSCTSCSTVGGVLSGCDCSGAVSGHTPQAVFDYEACGSAGVANCFGALVCQGQPCV